MKYVCVLFAAWTAACLSEKEAALMRVCAREAVAGEMK